METKEYYVDPPEGWRYGFPKLKTDEKELIPWLLSNGYPTRLIKEYGSHFHVRYWEKE